MAESDWKYVQRNKTTGQYKTTDEGGGGGASNFADLEDVDFDDLQDGQVPKYDAQNQKWINSNESGGGGNVDDVEVNGVSVLDQTDKIAKIKSYKEVTQAEYQALPSSKLTDNILYCIKDSAGADSFPPLIYSDEEREVGVWRDGKPLYQRTFIKTLSANAYVNLDTNIDSFFIVGNTYIGPNDSISEQYIDQNIRVYCFVQVYLDNGVRTMRMQNMYNQELTFVVTVRYTKTADIPGSGTWTTDGTYAHHYSIEEKVIGTWINGKPLYELTLYTAGPSNNFSIDLTDYNIDLITSMNGMYTFNGDQVTLPLSHTNGFVDQSFIRYNSDKTLLFAFGSYQKPASNIIATLQYTKTTD